MMMMMMMMMGLHRQAAWLFAPMGHIREWFYSLPAEEALLQIWCKIRNLTRNSNYKNPDFLSFRYWFFRVKTYRKRLTGAVRSFLSYLFVISGRFGEKKFCDFFRPLVGPISNHIGPNLTLSGTKSPKHGYMAIW